MQPIYTFIGGGNMGRALIGGLLASGHDATRLRVADAQATSRAACAEQFALAVYDDNRAAVRDADVVVLAVKPQQMAEVARGLADTANDATLYVSIAAGITSRHLAAWLGDTRAIVRCMPNTPALIGSGAAAMYANAHVRAQQRELANQLLAAVGLSWWLEDESQMDAVTALSGSGPAYFFMFIELLEKVAAELQLPGELARALALQTAIGASKLAAQSEHSPATLRQQVTSPGGTTERALAVFNSGNLEQLVREALTAARDRSLELAAEVKF
jgi:pyrroline-5-carboxylate reductase